MQILRDLLLAEATGRPTVLLRHAHRGELPPDARHRHVPLTAEGEDAARCLGSFLPPDRTLLLTHSGTTRTERTAQLLADGFADAGGECGYFETVRCVGGSYVHSDEVYLLCRDSDFMQRWFHGLIDTRLLDPPEAAASSLLQMLFDPAVSNCALPEVGELYVHVGHDWDIYVVQRALLGALPWDEPVEFLDGLALVRSACSIHGWRNGIRGGLAWPDKTSAPEGGA
ncbi:hypothetical protein ACFL59_04925 [Planctomycetota bacterium]